MRMPSTAHDVCRKLVDGSARQLRGCQFTGGRSYWLERDFQSFVIQFAERLKGKGTLASVRPNFRAPIPGWWPGAGDVDLAIEHKMNAERRFDFYEFKWCNSNKMEEALWDAVKLVNAHALPEVRNTYVVYGAPVRWWKDDVVGIRCFSPGETDLSKILGDHEDRWRVVLTGGTGRPRRVSKYVSIEPVVTRKLDIGDAKYEIRAVSIRPQGSATFSPVAS